MQVSAKLIRTRFGNEAKTLYQDTIMGEDDNDHDDKDKATWWKAVLWNLSYKIETMKTCGVGVGDDDGCDWITLIVNPD